MHGCLSTLTMAFAGLVIGASQAGAQTVNVSMWAHGAPLQEAVIATQPSLLAMIKGDIKWLPISSGPAALAGMKGGAYAIVNGVGNPPVTTAIANNINLKVVWAEFYDNAGFVLDGSLSPDDLAARRSGRCRAPRRILRSTAGSPRRALPARSSWLASNDRRWSRRSRPKRSPAA